MTRVLLQRIQFPSCGDRMATTGVAPI